ncbi:hypothetical protein NRIC_32870 [Enterococcus florum]|uniref:Uncharacterized protein n=1 Tax=Enterococcus florum TaxID=2480627 RepID=A0A4P5PC82_9ENTE|nr:hypothetical protein [Enterococcus florum]GCF95396.1 hypothetical protein NRIC_32870 [Enterococcus florum]
MFVLNVVNAVILAVVLGIVIYRLIIQFQVSRVEKTEYSDSKFQKKLHVFKQITSQKHVAFLLGLCLAIGVSLLLVTVNLFQLNQTVDSMKEQTSLLDEEIQRLSNQQEELITKIPIKDYPKEGIDLKKYEWDKVFGEERQEELQLKIETEISQKLAPYFGLSQVIVSVDVPTQSLSMSLTGSTTDIEGKEKIKKNVEAFVKEAKVIPRLTQVHVQVTSAVDKKNETLYEGIYLREKDKDAFKRQEESKKTDKEDED